MIPTPCTCEADGQPLESAAQASTRAASDAVVQKPKRRQARARTPIKPALLRRPEAAAFCAISVAVWDRLTASGGNPACIRLSGTPLWRRRELAAWIQAGCPGRRDW